MNALPIISVTLQLWASGKKAEYNNSSVKHPFHGMKGSSKANNLFAHITPLFKSTLIELF